MSQNRDFRDFDWPEPAEALAKVAEAYFKHEKGFRNLAEAAPKFDQWQDWVPLVNKVAEKIRKLHADLDAALDVVRKATECQRRRGRPAKGLNLDYIRKLREVQRLSAQEVADKLGVSRATLYRHLAAEKKRTSGGQ